MHDNLTIRTVGEASYQRSADGGALEVTVTATKDTIDEAAVVVETSTNMLEGLLYEHLSDGSAGLVNWNSWDVAPATTTAHEQDNQSTAQHTATTKFSIVFRNVHTLRQVRIEAGDIPHTTVGETIWHLSEHARAFMKREAWMAAIRDAIHRSEDFAEIARGNRTFQITEIEDLGATYEINERITGMNSKLYDLDAPKRDTEDLLIPGDVRVVWRVSAEFTLGND